jgi:hypothetical protein
VTRSPGATSQCRRCSLWCVSSAPPARCTIALGDAGGAGAVQHVQRVIERERWRRSARCWPHRRSGPASAPGLASDAGMAPHPRPGATPAARTLGISAASRAATSLARRSDDRRSGRRASRAAPAAHLREARACAASNAEVGRARGEHGPEPRASQQSYHSLDAGSTAYAATRSPSPTPSAQSAAGPARPRCGAPRASARAVAGLVEGDQRLVAGRTRAGASISARA